MLTIFACDNVDCFHVRPSVPTCEVHVLGQPGDARGELNGDEESHSPGAEEQQGDNLGH